MQSTPDTSPLGPELWTRYGANDADNSYTFPKADLPQAVVVNLGTNDFSYLNTRPALNATAFQQAYAQFIKTIQSHYPSAELFLTSSPLLSDSSPTPQDAQHTTMVNAIQGAIKSVGSAKLHFVDFPSQSGQSIGCDYHPGQAEHDIMAQILIPAIKAVLKW
jgi:lysophospholipase L1-like esterase